jgi:hypothetical protein
MSSKKELQSSLEVVDYHPEDELYPTRVMIEVEGDVGEGVVTLPVSEVKEFSQQLVSVMAQIALEQDQTPDELTAVEGEIAEQIEQIEPDETTD